LDHPLEIGTGCNHQRIELMSEPHNNRGFRIDPAWQRQGLMTEAVEVVTDFWFNALKFEVLRAPKAVANVASRQISEKSAMRLVATDERAYVSVAYQWRYRRLPLKSGRHGGSPSPPPHETLSVVSTHQ